MVQKPEYSTYLRTMNTLDLILAVVLLWGVIRGIMKGLFVSLASLIAIVAGIYIAIRFSSFVADALAESVSWEQGTINLVAFAITFVIVVLGISLAGKILTKIADFAALGLVNKLLGGLFGLFRMAFIASVILMFVAAADDYFSIISPESKAQSQLYQPVSAIAPYILPKLIKEAKDRT